MKEYLYFYQKITFSLCQHILTDFLFIERDNTKNKYLKTKIYKLTYRYCNSIYLDMCYRNFNMRYHEDIRFKMNKTNSKFGHHSFPEKSTKIIHCDNCNDIIRTFESVKIFKSQPSCSHLIIHNKLDFRGIF